MFKEYGLFSKQAHPSPRLGQTHLPRQPAVRMHCQYIAKPYDDCAHANLFASPRGFFPGQADLSPEVDAGRAGLGKLGIGEAIEAISTDRGGRYKELWLFLRFCHSSDQS